jgi:enoyl-CoA hydratase
MSDCLLVRNQGPARILTLNRPKVLNALDAELRRRIAEEIRKAHADKSVRAVIVTGAGDRAFCAGQDLNEAKEQTAATAAEWQRTWTDFTHSFLECHKPIIAAINGVAAGGGFVMAALADVKVMARPARFIMAEINIGLPSIIGSYLLLKQIFLSRTIDIVLTGRDIPSHEAKAMGFVHEVVEPADVMTRALALADEFAKKKPTPMRLTIGRMRAVLLKDWDGLEKAAQRYQGEAVASGEPQRVQAQFLADRAARAR